MDFLGTISITWRIVAKRDVSAVADSKRLIEHSLGRAGGSAAARSASLSARRTAAEKNFCCFLDFQRFPIKILIKIW